MSSIKNVLYILALAHSGSTVLCALLGRHADAVALGEAHKSLGMRAGSRSHDDTTRICTCGVAMHDCLVWSTHVKHVASRGDDYADQYMLLVKNEALEDYKIFVDASKGTGKLKRLRHLEQKGIIRLHVVFLLKDVRAWIVSARENSVRKHTKLRSRFSYGLQWYRENARMKRLLDGMRISYSQVGYEELCRDPAGTASRIFAKAGIPSKAFDMARAPNMHMVYGNRIRTQGRLTSITYDSRGMGDPWVNVVVALLPSVFLWNRAHAHGTGTAPGAVAGLVRSMRARLARAARFF